MSCRLYPSLFLLSLVLSSQCCPPKSWLENVIESRPQHATKPIIHPQQRRTSRHYHLVENRIGDPLSYRDDVFTTRRRASDEARTRVQWLAAAGFHVEAVTGSRRRYLVTRRRTGDPGCLIQVEACEDPGCLERDHGTRC